MYPACLRGSWPLSPMGCADWASQTWRRAFMRDDEAECPNPGASTFLPSLVFAPCLSSGRIFVRSETV